MPTSPQNVVGEAETPLGRFRVILQDGRVVAAGFVTRDLGDDSIVGAMIAEAASDYDANDDAEASPSLRAVLVQVDEYFQGTRTSFDAALAPSGTPFQQRVWALLGAISFGETVSYGELAAKLGDPGASRAVGAANGKNPIALLIPCHRVVGASGSLTGYAGGIERKRSLLALERRVRFGSLGI